jgi:hypothetical protein
MVFITGYAGQGFGSDSGHGGEHCPLNFLALLQNQGKPFFIISSFHIHTIHLSIAIRWGLSPSPHCLKAQWEDPRCGAEPRIELGPALQQADALPTGPRRTLSYPSPWSTCLRSRRENVGGRGDQYLDFLGHFICDWFQCSPRKQARKGGANISYRHKYHRQKYRRIIEMTPQKHTVALPQNPSFN